MRLTLEEVSYRLLPRVELGRALAHSEWNTLAAVAEVLLDGCPVSLRPEQVADNVEQFMIRGRSRRAWRIRVLLTLVELMPIGLGRGRFSALDHETRRRIVEQRFVEGHHLWGVCAKVRMLALMGIYGDMQSGAAVGFVPVPLRRSREASRGGAALGIHPMPSSPKE